MVDNEAEGEERRQFVGNKKYSQNKQYCNNKARNATGYH